MELVDISHHSIAQQVIDLSKDKFRCASIKYHLWYEFTGHKWVEIDTAYSLRKFITNEFETECINKQTLLCETLKDAKCDGYEKKRYLDEVERIGHLIFKLHNHHFLNSVIKECETIAFDPKFLDNMDEKKHLIGFTNGVYDLEQDIFRDGHPDDYITLCTNYDYVLYDENSPIVMEINDFFSKIQSDEKTRKCLILILSMCISGSITEESFYILTGSGSNGKSKLMELMRYTLGDYFKPMDINLLTEKISSSSVVTPEIADKKGIRVCSLNEPKSNDKINTSFIKILVGGDIITARALCKDPIYFKPQFKPFLLCNHLPIINTDDGGIWRRLRVIPFLSKFIKPKDIQGDLPPNHFWADTNLSEKLYKWKEMFMAMLIIHHRIYKREGIILSGLIMKSSTEYRNTCDIYKNFIDDYLEKTDNINSMININLLYSNMRSWYKNNYDGKCPQKIDLRIYIQTKLENNYDKSKDSLTGYKIKPWDNDIDELDNLIFAGESNMPFLGKSLID
jgi:P4 family phage/plasmid primase-like protien